MKGDEPLKECIKKLKNAFLPLLLVSAIAGFFVGVIIFFFRCAGNFVVRLSHLCYDFAGNGVWQGLLIFAGITVLCIGARFIMKAAPFSKGGGIPFSVVLSSVKLKFNWLFTLIATFVSSLITFFVGVPLGNEGPSVQIGALTGLGVLKAFKKENAENASCIIKSGAGAGFCAATGSVLGGFAFSIEEMHGKIKPMQILSSFISVISAYCTAAFFCNIFKIDFNLFHKLSLKPLPFKYYFIPIIVGAVCGAAAILFSRAAIAVRRFIGKAKVPILVQIFLTFSVAFLLAVFFEDAAFSGHDLIETLFSAEPIWYATLILIAVRATMLIFSNSQGITGGLFVPLLTLGALLGAACLAIFNLAGVQVGEYAVYFIITGLAAFIASANKMPLSVTLFTAEIVCGFKNILPVLLAVSVSYLIFHLVRQKELTEVICEELYEKNKSPERN